MIVENIKLQQYEDALSLFEITIIKVVEGDFWSVVCVSEEDEDQAYRLLKDLN